MYYKYISSSRCQKLICIYKAKMTSQLIKNEQIRSSIKCSDRVNIPCLIRDIRFCQIHVKMTKN